MEQILLDQPLGRKDKGWNQVGSMGDDQKSEFMARLSTQIGLGYTIRFRHILVVFVKYSILIIFNIIIIILVKPKVKI